ncbi:MAG: ROK family protein [Bacteroidota bacterium]
MKRKALGVDIGGTHIKSGIVDLDTGELHTSTVVSTKVDSKATAEVIFEQWASCINKSLETYNAEELLGIGFALPGPFNYQTGIAYYSKNDKYESLYGLKLIDHIRPLINIAEDRPFRFYNDASCFAIGEDVYGSGTPYQKTISVTLGTGFGSAFLTNGFPVVKDNNVPDDGCLWHLPYGRGIADDYFSTRWFVNTYQDRTGNLVKGVKELVDQYEQDKAIAPLFDEFGRSLGTFLAPWIERFAAEAVIIGGNIARSFDYFSDGFTSATGMTLATRIPFLKAHHWEDASIIGSARLLDDEYYTVLKKYLPTQ